MPRHTGLIDWNPDWRVQKLFHREHDGDWVYETKQDCDPILDFNKYRQNHVNPAPFGDARHVASIPPIIILKWKAELGIDYYNKDHQPAVNRLLNSSEWQWLRTDRSML